MIQAKHHTSAHFIFRIYLKHFLLKDFSAIYMLNEMPLISPGTSILLCPNHSSWFDGFIPYFLNEKFFRKKYFILMLENQLRKFPFFRKLGAFGMNQNSPTDIRRMLSYMSELLHPDHMIVYFPQGKIVPDVPAPFILSKGLTYLQTKYPVQILPLRMHWESLNTRKPAVFISWGTPIPLEQYKAHTELLNEQFEALRNKETAALTTGNFGTCIYGKKHVGF